VSSVAVLAKSDVNTLFVTETERCCERTGLESSKQEVDELRANKSWFRHTWVLHRTSERNRTTTYVKYRNMAQTGTDKGLCAEHKTRHGSCQWCQSYSPTGWRPHRLTEWRSHHLLAVPVWRQQSAFAGGSRTPYGTSPPQAA
jgi:hypothetical protein